MECVEAGCVVGKVLKGCQGGNSWLSTHTIGKRWWRVRVCVLRSEKGGVRACGVAVEGVPTQRNGRQKRFNPTSTGAASHTQRPDTEHQQQHAPLSGVCASPSRLLSSVSLPWHPRYTRGRLRVHRTRSKEETRAEKQTRERHTHTGGGVRRDTEKNHAAEPRGCSRPAGTARKTHGRPAELPALSGRITATV